MGIGFFWNQISSAPPGVGVYEIVNLKNGKRYVGSAAQVCRNRGYRFRWREHLRDLEAGRHHSQKLQRAWVKHGRDAFVFRVLRNVSAFPEATFKERLLLAEQSEMDAGGVRANYNVNPTAGSQLGFRHSEEAKRRISASVSGRVVSDETRAKLKEAQARRRAAGLGVSDETRAKMRTSALRRVSDPEQRAMLLERARKGVISAKARPSPSIGRKATPEQRAAMSARMKARFSCPDARKAHVEAMAFMKGRQLTTETVERMREAAKTRSADPEYIAKMAAGVRRAHENMSPEARVARSANIRAGIVAAKERRIAEKAAKDGLRFQDHTS